MRVAVVVAVAAVVAVVAVVVAVVEGRGAGAFAEAELIGLPAETGMGVAAGTTAMGVDVAPEALAGAGMSALAERAFGGSSDEGATGVLSPDPDSPPGLPVTKRMATKARLAAATSAKAAPTKRPLRRGAMRSVGGSLDTGATVCWPPCDRDVAPETSVGAAVRFAT